MRIIDNHHGPDSRIDDPAKCPGCGAEKARRKDAEGDDMAVDISFTCGAEVRWRSVVCGGSEASVSESLAEIKTCPGSLSAVLAKARAAHPDMRVGQLVWTAAWIAIRADGRDIPGNDTNLVFYIDDESLAWGLDKVAREKSLPGDGASQLADRIRSYLTRKTGSSLDGETVDHVARIIRESR